MSPLSRPRSTRSLASGQTTDLEREAESAGSTDVDKLTSMAAGPDGDEKNGPGATLGDGIYDPKSVKFWTIMLCNFLALFLVALDRTILATAVPRITDEFHSLGDVGWYGSAYMLTTSASQLVFGRVYKFYSMKWTFLICIIVFEVGSAICGAAPNSIVFILGRAIAGLASAGIFTGCSMIFMVVPLHRRPMFQGFFGMVFGIASVMGPLIGGGFTGTISWRWCFYINLPIGAVSLVFMVLWWNPPKREIAPAPVATHIKRLDPLGTLFFLPAIVALLLALQWGGSTYAWDSALVIALFVVFGVLILAFVVVQVTLPDTATIPPKVITHRSVLSGAVFTFFLAGSMLICVYFLPIWFQTAKGVDPLQSGIFTLPLVLSLVASSILSGIFTQKIGYYVPSMILSPILMSVGQGLLSILTPGSPSSHWIAFQFLTGFGLGLGMQTSGLAVQTVLPLDDVSTGIAIVFFTQQLGGAIFTTVGQTILSNVLVSQLDGVHGLHPEAIIKAGITDLLSAVPPEARDLVVNAYNFACTRIFLAAMGLAFGSLISALFMEWRSIKKPHHGGGGPARGANPGVDSGGKGGIPLGAVRIGSQEAIESAGERKVTEAAEERRSDTQAIVLGRGSAEAVDGGQPEKDAFATMARDKEDPAASGDARAPSTPPQAGRATPQLDQSYSSRRRKRLS